MSVEGSNPPGKGEEATKELALAEKREVEELIPVVAQLKACGYPDWRIRENQQTFHPGKWWDKIIDVALKTVTEEQVRRAKEDGIQDAMAYVTSQEASERLGVHGKNLWAVIGKVGPLDTNLAGDCA
jgi:hypothetical protein